MASRFIFGGVLWLLVLWGFSFSESAQAGVSLQYVSARRVPESTILKVKADAERVNRKRAWWCESISFRSESHKPGLDDEYVEQVRRGVYVRGHKVEPGMHAREPHPGSDLTGKYLVGDTKMYCVPRDGRVEPAFGVVEYMSWRDSLFVIEVLRGWSERFGLTWELNLAGEPVGKVVAGKPDTSLTEFLARWGRSAHAYGDAAKDEACDRALAGHPREQAWTPLPVCPQRLFVDAASAACKLARLLEAGWQRCDALERRRNPKHASRFRVPLMVHPDGKIVMESMRRWGFTHRPPPPGEQHHGCLVTAVEGMGQTFGPQGWPAPRRMECDQRQVPDGFHGKYLTKPPEIPKRACVRGKTACWLAEP